MIVRLFVYGTLAPGGDAWPVLERWVVGDAVADSAAGRLYDTGRGYPAATFDGEAATIVHGSVVTLDPDQTPEALHALDRYEGHEYERITVRTRNGLEAATYAWIAPLGECRPVADGRWNRPPDRGPQT